MDLFIGRKGNIDAQFQEYPIWISYNWKWAKDLNQKKLFSTNFQL